MNNVDLNAKSIKSALTHAATGVRKYASVVIFLLFMAVYGYMIAQINSLSNPTLDQSTVAAEAKALPKLKLDEEAVKKLQSLNDNSVNVQTLFEQGRSNPFEE